MIKKYLKSPDLIFCVFPIFALMLIYIYFFSSHLVLGYWPTPYHPDPKTKILQDSIGILYSITIYSLHFSFYSIIGYILFIPYRILYYKESDIVAKVLIWLINWGIVIAWFKADPSRVIEWYFD